MDIGAWLHGLGLGQYEAAFRDNRIDASVLPELTAEDLKEIGVAAVGHRASCSPPSPRSTARAPPPPRQLSRGRPRGQHPRRRYPAMAEPAPAPSGGP